MKISVPLRLKDDFSKYTVDESAEEEYQKYIGRGIVCLPFVEASIGESPERVVANVSDERPVGSQFHELKKNRPKFSWLDGHGYMSVDGDCVEAYYSVQRILDMKFPDAAVVYLWFGPIREIKS